MTEFSWVTLATNDSYSLGALVLAYSLKRVRTAHQLVVLVTPGVTQPMREKLRSVFDLVFEVNILDSKDERNLLLLQRPELGITFTKLHCWRLTQYKKCVFLDADTLVLQNCDELFDRDEFSAAPDVGWPDCFNSGVFVYKPSDETFNSLLSFALEKGSFDGGDQGLLNLYFSDWAHKDISKHLPFIYNMCSTACYSYLPAFKQFGENVKIVHFIGNSKPWLQYFNSVSLEVSCTPEFQHLQLVFEHWWNLFCSHVHSGLQPTMARINTPIASPSSSHILAYYINESKCEDRLCTEQFCGTDVIDIPIWDPWENYQPVDSSIESRMADVPILDNLNTEPSSNSYYVENMENKIESSFHESYNYNTQSNNVSNNVNIENNDCKSHVDIDSTHSLTQEEPVPYISITSEPSPPPNSCTYNEPQSPDHRSQSAYQSVTSTVLCDAKSASTVTITTEQQATTHASKTEPRPDSNGGLAGAFAQITLRQPRSDSQNALEDHLRRQGWETGRIDYLGQDSFDNVWKKICETMTGASIREPSPPKQVATISPVLESIPVSVPTSAPASVAEPVVAPIVEPVSVSPCASVVPPASAPAPLVDLVIASVTSATPTSPTAPVSSSEPSPASAAISAAPTPEVVSAPVPAPTAAPEVVAAPVSAPTAAPEVVAAPVSAPTVAPEVVAAPAPPPTVAPEVVAAPAPASTVAPEVVAAPVPTPAIAPEVIAAPIPAPTVAPEVVAASVPAPKVVAAPAVAPSPVIVAASATAPPIVAPSPEVVPAPTVASSPAPVPEASVVPPAAPKSVSAPATVPDVACPITEPAAATVAPSTDSGKEVASESKAIKPTSSTVAEPPKKETEAVEVQKSAEAEIKKPAEKTKIPEGKKETSKSKTKTSEGPSSESTPVPPPRKSGKNGGAVSKKTTKKK